MRGKGGKEYIVSIISVFLRVLTHSGWLLAIWTAIRVERILDIMRKKERGRAGDPTGQVSGATGANKRTESEVIVVPIKAEMKSELLYPIPV